MNAIRQIVEVKDHKLQIELPKDFDATSVEVIIFPRVEEFDFDITDEEKTLMRERLKNSTDEDFEDWDAIKHNYV